MACGNKVPGEYVRVQALPNIYPDYTDVTVPVNIAPLTFEMRCNVDEMVARYTVGTEELVCGGKTIQPDEDDWKRLMQAGCGKSVKVEVFVRRDGQWKGYKPFLIHVSPDSIDAWLSYRLIAPSYVSYEELTINQRCLENYDERVIYDNMMCSYEDKGQCINCHNYQQYNPDRMQFHARQSLGGTLIACDGELRKIDMRNDSLLSAGVYPAWHPWLKLIVYSTNTTQQSFHTVDRDKIEVYDSESDLIAYDVENNEVTNIENDPQEFEVFPCWSPDGKSLYYCSAHFEYDDSIEDRSLNVLSQAYDIKYNIYKKLFDPQTMRFGKRQLVFDAKAMGKSATFPRVSPDGRYLMFTMGHHGVFHIWHHDADLWMMDLKTGTVRPMRELNSRDTESYHSWSSNGRWVVFSSRRDDGNYTRPFFAHVDAAGRGSKPFELPCAHPDYHRQLLKCYNIPEFMRGPVSFRPQAFARVLRGKGMPVKYVQQLKKQGK
jgi:hypothetical protein